MTYLWCFLGGTVLGAFYVACLWGAVVALPKIRRKTLWLMTGILLRLMLLFLGLLWLSQKDIGRFSVAFAGFLLVRFCALTYEKKKIREVLKNLHG